MGTIEVKKSLAQLLLEAKTEFVNNILGLMEEGQGILISSVWVPTDVMREVVNSMNVIIKDKSIVLSDITIPIDAMYSPVLVVLKQALVNFIKITLTGDDFPVISDMIDLERMAGV